ncbi:MAG: SufE family protein [Verrucomicrobiota bacterium]
MLSPPVSLPAWAPDVPVADRIRGLQSALASRADFQARLAWLVDEARRQPSLAAERRTADRLVPGCQVRLWWIPGWHDGRCWFASDSDAVSLKALAGLLGRVHDGAAPAEILGAAPGWLAETGLLRPLAESRRATVLRVHDLIREFARVHQGPPRVQT